MESAPRTLRRDWPFRRVALVLSGGGALGAYEVGVLKVLEAVGLRPAIVAGVSVGAVNALSWVVHGFRAQAVERLWATLGAASLGIRWNTLALRFCGIFVMAVGGFELLLTLASSPELSLSKLFWRHAAGADLSTVLLDALAWALVAGAGLALALLTRQVESLFARLAAPGDPLRFQRWLGRALVAGVFVHLVTWGLDLPWPQRFGATLLVIGTLVWLANRPGRTGDRLRRLFMRLLPETGGRGLWGGAARRRVLEGIVASGDPGRLTDGAVHLIIGACAVDSGRVCHFINWHAPSPGFIERVEHELGEVVVAPDAVALIQATLASSALPVIYEPVRIGGRDFVDAGGFSNQPLHVAIADGADAMLTVLLSPSARPPAPPREPTLFELGARLLELANWRDMQAELRSLPPGWTRHGDPARVCVVEPESTLPGGVLGFDPRQAIELVARGERDAWTALARAGWLAPAPAAGASGA